MVALAAALAGCDSVEGAVKKDGPAARAVVEKATEVAKDLGARPLVPASSLVKPDGERLRIAEDDDSANSEMVYLEDLKAPGELGNVYARIRSTDTLSTCASFVLHGTPPWDPRDPTRWGGSVYAGEVTRSLQYCAKLKALFVLRTTELVKPSNARVDGTKPTALTTDLIATPLANAAARGDAGARVDAGAASGTRTVVVTKPRTGADGGAPRDAGPPPDAGPPAPFVLPPRGTIVPATLSACRDETNRCVYDGGYMRVEVHVYGLDPVVKYRGAFVVEAESSSSLDLDTSDVEAALEQDLRQQLRRAFRTALLEYAGETWIGGFQ